MMRVTIIKPGVFDAYGIAMIVGSTYTVGDEFGKSLVLSLKATDTDLVLQHEIPGPFDAAVEGDTLALGTGVEKATENTRRLQASINSLSCRITNPGTYYINDTLIVPSNALWYSAPGVIYKQAFGTNKPMVKFAGQLATPTTVTTNWTAALDCPVAWTAHGRSVGDWIWLDGANESPFKGVFLVSSITDADNLVVRLRRIPTANGTGTIVARVATVGSKIIGGTFDYNFAENAAAVGIDNFACFLGGAAHCSYENINSINAPKYAFMIGASAHAKLLNCRADDTDSDCVKVYGPAYDTLIDNFFGSNTDDFISFQTKEAAAFSQYRWTWGDIIGVLVRNVTSHTQAAAGSVVTLYGSAAEYFDDISLDGIHGEGASAYSSVKVIPSAGEASARVGMLYLNGITARSQTPIAISGAVTVESLAITNFKPATLTATGQILNVSTTSIVRVLRVASMDFVDATYATGVTNAIAIDGQVDMLIVENSVVRVGGVCRLISAQNAASNIREIILKGNQLSGVDNAIVLVTTANAPTIHAEGNDLQQSAACILNATVSCKINMVGNRLANPSAGAIKVGGGTVTVAWSGNNLVAGSAIVATAGTVIVNSLECPVDVGATGFVKTTSGQMAFNTGAARGTLTQNRLVTCNGTNWVQVDNPALLF